MRWRIYSIFIKYKVDSPLFHYQNTIRNVSGIRRQCVYVNNWRIPARPSQNTPIAKIPYIRYPAVLESSPSIFINYIGVSNFEVFGHNGICEFLNPITC